jgi:hypothetical protein
MSFKSLLQYKTQNVMAEPPSPRRLNLIAESMPYCQTAQKLDPLISYYSFIVLETRKCQTSLFHLWTSNASTYCWNEKIAFIHLFSFNSMAAYTHNCNISKWETSMQYMICKLFWGQASIFLITSAVSTM